MKTECLISKDRYRRRNHTLTRQKSKWSRGERQELQSKSSSRQIRKWIQTSLQLWLSTSSDNHRRRSCLSLTKASKAYSRRNRVSTRLRRRSSITIRHYCGRRHRHRSNLASLRGTRVFRSYRIHRNRFRITAVKLSKVVITVSKLHNCR